MAKHFPELDKVLETSELLSAVKRVKALKPSGKAVSESPELQKQMEASGCWAADWSKVRVAEGFSAHRVAAVKFFGEVQLGKFSDNEVDAQKGVKMPAGVYHSVVVDSVICDDALVCNVGTLANAVVGPEGRGAQLRVGDLQRRDRLRQRRRDSHRHRDRRARGAAPTPS